MYEVVCRKCGEIFHSAKLFSRHWRSGTAHCPLSDTGVRYRCQYCSCAMASLASLRHHITLRHNADLGSPSVDPAQLSELTVYVYFCSTVDPRYFDFHRKSLSFKNDDNKKDVVNVVPKPSSSIHISDVKSEGISDVCDEFKLYPLTGCSSNIDLPQCDNGESTKTNDETTQNNRWPPNNIYRCPHCPYWSEAGSIDQHLRIHTREFPYTCPLCPTSYAQRKTARSHLQRVHDIKSYECACCPELFITETELKLHEKRLHKYPKKASHDRVCWYCHETFKSKLELGYHVANHREKDGYKWNCPKCRIGFRSREQLRQHKRAHEKSKQRAKVGVTTSKLVASKTNTQSKRIVSSNKQHQIKIRSNQHNLIDSSTGQWTPTVSNITTQVPSKSSDPVTRSKLVSFNTNTIQSKERIVSSNEQDNRIDSSKRQWASTIPNITTQTVLSRSSDPVT